MLSCDNRRCSCSLFEGDGEGDGQWLEGVTSTAANASTFCAAARVRVVNGDGIAHSVTDDTPCTTGGDSGVGRLGAADATASGTTGDGNSIPASARWPTHTASARWPTHTAHRHILRRAAQSLHGQQAKSPGLASCLAANHSGEASRSSCATK